MQERSPAECSGWAHAESLPFLKVMERLLSSVKPLEVFHHLLHVLLRVAVLDIGKPAATHSDDNRHHQHEVFQVVVTSY